ncbi:MAG: glutamate-5-semialdehyde dehydrogenase [Candidatus Omnitrophica bacterium]|nr:glutamate-5-semialdehyde dehydrogenase [Candidatus Omnitrophota bacterium]
MDAVKKIDEMAISAGSAEKQLSVMSTKQKNIVLTCMADSIFARREEIKKANDKDIAAAKKDNKNKAFIERLRLDDKRIDGMVQMIKEVADLDDPVGEVIEKKTRPNGLVIEKVRVPIGVIGIIYESRPNVTAECIALCFKSGNAAILRGGSCAINSNKAIFDALKKAAEDNGVKEGAFGLIEDTSRLLVGAMLTADGKIDLIMPRGGEDLIREVVSKSTIPVIKHYKGICHVYVDSESDLDMAEEICLNAKIERPGVCNAMETLLVHNACAGEFLPKLAEKLIRSGVKIKGCEKTIKILGEEAEKATEKDFATEWLDLVLNVRIVDSPEEAIEHISRFGSRHSDAVVTKNKKNADKFLREVDSAVVYVNASTRFTDGGEFGKGAEIGISTDKIHARGPMGLEELCSYKYVVHGTGQIRER